MAHCVSGCRAGPLLEIAPEHDLTSPQLSQHSAHGTVASRVGKGYLRTKRAMDLTFASFGIVLLAPLMAAIALAVAVSSRGPVIFRQQRLGRYGSPFNMYKFRSMRVSVPGAVGPLVTATGDPRVTPLGRQLRRYKLDELPQLVNVLRGDMSLVGPRPEVARYARSYPEEYRRILSIRPGITDFATLEYRDEEELLARSADPESAYVNEVLPKKIDLYMRYLDECSLRTDMTVLALTLLRVLRPSARSR